MRKQTIETTSESNPEWDTLAHWLGDRMQELVQHVLEEDVTDFLGRAKSVRRSDTGHRNGYAKSRKQSERLRNQFAGGVQNMDTSLNRRYGIETGRRWSRSMTTRRNTGSIFGPPTRWNHRSRLEGEDGRG